MFLFEFFILSFSDSLLRPAHPDFFPAQKNLPAQPTQKNFICPKEFLSPLFLGRI